jgi:hypothetical protein
MTVATLGILAAIVSFTACIEPPAAAPVNPIYVSSSASVVANDSGPGQEPYQPPPPPQAATARILVLADKHVDRPTEVLGVLDFHSAATSEDKGFDELRARAAAMGADAVIGAEFEHGDGNEPSHLSGMVVRFLGN